MKRATSLARASRDRRLLVQVRAPKHGSDLATQIATLVPPPDRSGADAHPNALLESKLGSNQKEKT